MPTFNQLSQLTQNLGFAIAVATFLVFMLAVLVIWQMRDLRDMQVRHAGEREASDRRHTVERADQEMRHSSERGEWRQTQAALLARFAEAQERDKIELIGELKQQTRLLERMDERRNVTAQELVVPPRRPATAKRDTKSTIPGKEHTDHES